MNTVEFYQKWVRDTVDGGLEGTPHPNWTGEDRSMLRSLLSDYQEMVLREPRLYEEINKLSERLKSLAKSIHEQVREFIGCTDRPW